MPNISAPREDRLLNGMRVLVWSNPNAEKVSVRLRFHSGAAFDLQGKEGTMALLSEILFPNEAAKEFFTEDLNGSFEIICNYDFIEINLSGDNDKFLDILEPLANAIQNTQIDKETTEKVKAKHLVKVQELEKNPMYLAKMTAAKRLLGNFPYGRPMFGTTESLAKIDFADILFAKQKYLTSDNATLTVAGNVKPDFVFRAAKRLLGNLVKADRKIPPTFTSPNPPDIRNFLTQIEMENTSELCYAFRGLARNDKDFSASEVLTKILQDRLQTEKKERGTVRQEAHFLRGIVFLEMPKWNVGNIQIADNKITLPGEFFNFVAELMKSDVTSAEFEKAKSEFLKTYNSQSAVDLWLNNHTFQTMPVKDEMQKTNALTLADVQRVLDNWRKEAVTVSLVITASK